MSDSDDMKATDASLFLFAVSTGARGVSCYSIRLKDIIGYSNEQGTNKKIISINIPKTKWNSHYNHKVSLDGDEYNKSSDNFIYWL